MTQRLHQTFLRQVVALAGRLGDTDAELLRRYAERHEEAAFAELHRRHGPLVWAVCRHLLPNPADAEDAYQVTFLALVTSAGRVRNGSALGAWLHGVAVRTAARLKRSAVRRRHREEKVAAGEADRTVPEAAWTGLLAAVHEEVERLPPQLRTAFVLCDLQGVRQPDAAAQLGWKPGTLTGRLTKARQRLTQSLKERGIAPASAAGALGVAVTAAGAALVPAPMAERVHHFAAGAADAPPMLHQLAREMTAMRHTKWLAAGLAVAAALGLWLGGAALPSAGGQQTADPFTAGGAQEPDPVRKTRTEPPVEPLRDLAGKSAGWRYKYVPLPEDQPAETLRGTMARLEEEAAAGWEFCGTIEIYLRPSEYEALRAGKEPKQPLMTKERHGLHRVLVFKRSAPAEKVSPPQVATILLKQADVAQVAELLTKVMQKNPNFRIVVDTRTNSVTFTADVANIVSLRRLVEDIDRLSSAKDAATLQRYYYEMHKKLDHDMVEATLLQRYYDRLLQQVPDKPKAGEPLPKRPGANPPTEPEPEPEFQIFRLKHSSAQDMAKVLSDLFQKNRNARLNIVTDPHTNSLLIQGEPAIMVQVKRVLEALDIDSKPKDKVPPPDPVKP